MLPSVHGRLVCCYLRYIHASRDLRSAFRLRRLAETGVWSGCFPPLLARSCAVPIFGLGGRLFVASAGDRSGLLRCADFVADAVGDGLRCTVNFTVGALNRGLWTCGSLSGKYRAKAAFRILDVLLLQSACPGCAAVAATTTTTYCYYLILLLTNATTYQYYYYHHYHCHYHYHYHYHYDYDYDY